MFKKITLLFLLWRGLLFVPLIVSHSFLNMRSGYHYTLVPYFTKAANTINHFVISPWGNFDGIYYLLIAAKGYTVNAGFFPLFPLTIRFASSIFGNLLPFDPLQYLAANLLVNAYFFLSLVLLYKLVRLDHSEKISFLSIVALLAFPTSFFFVSIYTESLFLMLTLMSFYFARRRKWVWASICGGLLTATRIVGIAILPAIMWEIFIQEKLIDRVNSCYHAGPPARRVLEQDNIVRNKLRVVIRCIFSMRKMLIPLILVPVGLVSYMWFNLVNWGDALFFIKAQGSLQNNRSVGSLVFLPQTLFRYIKIFLTVSPKQYEWWIALLEFASFILAAWLLYIAWKKRVRASYVIFSVFAILIPTLTGTLSGLPRYVVVLFPIFLVLALLDKKYQIVYLTVGSVLLFICLLLFSQGYFIA